MNTNFAEVSEEAREYKKKSWTGNQPGLKNINSDELGKNKLTVGGNVNSAQISFVGSRFQWDSTQKFSRFEFAKLFLDLSEIPISSRFR